MSEENKENKEKKEKEEQKIEHKEKETENNKKTKEIVPKEDYDELEDRYKRILAEFENFKKRSIKEREGLYNSILSDDLENAAKVETKDEEYKKGVELVLKQLKDVLQAKGIEEIKTVGETFDPELHEAVSSIQDENLGTQEIAQEYRKGYKIGNRVIRHSMVVVAN